MPPSEQHGVGGGLRSLAAFLVSLVINTWYATVAYDCAEEFLLEDVKNYSYLTHGNVPVAGQDDAELYRQLVEAMDIMGFTKDEQDGTLLMFSSPIRLYVYFR